MLDDHDERTHLLCASQALRATSRRLRISAARMREAALIHRELLDDRNRAIASGIFQFAQTSNAAGYAQDELKQA
jgi:hypothetical protein